MGAAPVIMSLIVTFPCSNVHTWGRLKTQSPILSPFYSWVGNTWPINFHVVEEAGSPVTTFLIFITFPLLTQARLKLLRELALLTF